MDNATVKRLADAYVANMTHESYSGENPRWFPQHEDDTVRKVKWFHEELSKQWRQDSPDHA